LLKKKKKTSLSFPIVFGPAHLPLSFFFFSSLRPKTSPRPNLGRSGPVRQPPSPFFPLSLTRGTRPSWCHTRRRGLLGAHAMAPGRPLFKVPRTLPWIPLSSHRPLQQTLAPPPLELRLSLDSMRSRRSATSPRCPSVPGAPPRDKKQPDSSSPLSRGTSPRQSLTVAPLRCLATEHAPSRVYSPPEPRQRVRRRALLPPDPNPSQNPARMADSANAGEPSRRTASPPVPAPPSARPTHPEPFDRDPTVRIRFDLSQHTGQPCHIFKRAPQFLGNQPAVHSSSKIITEQSFLFCFDP